MMKLSGLGIVAGAKYSALVPDAFGLIVPYPDKEVCPLTFAGAFAGLQTVGTLPAVAGGRQIWKVAAPGGVTTALNC
jgi:hypothetical protein